MMRHLTSAGSTRCRLSTRSTRTLFIREWGRALYKCYNKGYQPHSSDMWWKATLAERTSGCTRPVTRRWARKAIEHAVQNWHIILLYTKMWRQVKFSLLVTAERMTPLGRLNNIIITQRPNNLVRTIRTYTSFFSLPSMKSCIEIGTPTRRGVSHDCLKSFPLEECTTF